MKRKLILFLIVSCCLLGCNRKSDKPEGLLESTGAIDDINASDQNEHLWESIVNKV